MQSGRMMWSSQAAISPSRLFSSTCTYQKIWFSTRNAFPPPFPATTESKPIQLPDLRLRPRLSPVCFSALGERKWIEGSGDEIIHRFNKKQKKHLHQQDEEEEEEVEEVNEANDDKKRRAKVLAAAAATVVLGTANRVFYKLALVPLKQYPFFLAQIATVGYVVVYFSILYWRYHAGIVTDEMLSLPKTPYIVVGLLEALGAASGMAAGAVLSGASIPILSQTFLIWQILLSTIFLGRRYRPNQILGCCLVSIGVVLTVMSGSGGGLPLKDAGIFWALLMITSFLLQAADTVLKEIIFLNARNKCKGRSLDLFVVNSFGSAFQALFLCLLVPFLSKLWGVPFSQLPTYMRDGAGCFLNIGTVPNGCEGAPLLPLIFVVVNMAFNVSLLHLLKISSAVVSCLASTFTVPISIFAFTLPLPYIGSPSSLPAGFLAGAAVLVLGLLLYCSSPTNQSTSLRPKKGV